MNDSVAEYLDELWQRLNEVQRWAGFLSPVISLPAGLNPVASIGALIAVIVTTGLAVGALAALLSSLLVLYLLLTQVFGVRFGVALP